MNQTVTHADGTRTVLVQLGDMCWQIDYDPTGVETARVERPDLPVTEADWVEPMSGEELERVRVLGLGLITNAELLDQAVSSIAVANTAKVPLQTINSAVQAAASPDLNQTLQEETQ